MQLSQIIYKYRVRKHIVLSIVMNKREFSRIHCSISIMEQEELPKLTRDCGWGADTWNLFSCMPLSVRRVTVLEGYPELIGAVKRQGYCRSNISLNCHFFSKSSNKNLLLFPYCGIYFSYKGPSICPVIGLTSIVGSRSPVGLIICSTTA